MDSKTKARLSAYEQLAKGRAKELREADGRHSAHHKRFRRGFVRVAYGPYEIKFHPIKEWSRYVSVTSMTFRNWLKRDIIRAVYMHDMPVMCVAELLALKAVVLKWHNSRDIHNAIEPAFRAELNEALTKVRLALDSLKRNCHIDDHQRALLEPSLEFPDA
jgi:hypothetical protein